MSKPEFAELKNNLKNLEIELFRRFEFEEKLRDSEKKYQNLIENMHNGLIVICENKVVFSNKAFVNLLGYTNKELYNLPFKNLFEPDFQKKILDRIKKVVSGKRVLNPFPVKIIAKDNKTIKVNFNCNHIIFEGNDASQILVRDLTEKTFLEQEIAEQKEAVVFNRMESLAITGRLASGIAHEINNPLQGIKGQLYLLVKNLPEKFKKSSQINLINEGIDRIGEIVNRLLDLHREDKKLSYKTRLEPVIEQIKMLLSTQMLKQKISIETAIADKDLEIPLSNKLLNQVLLNLILNAQDSMPNGGVIHILAKRSNDEVEINVSDEGTGILQKNILMIFSPFYTTKGTKGTGLGLSITHSIITEAGGKIEVESEPEKGTTFSILLPCHKEKSL